MLHFYKIETYFHYGTYVAALTAWALFISLCMPYDAYAARLWSSGCEFQGDSPGNATTGLEWTVNVSGAGSSQISSTVKRSGLSSCKLIRATSGWGGFEHQYSATDVSGPNYFRFYFYLETAPADDTDIALLNNTTDNTIQTIMLKTDRTLAVLDSDDTTELATYTTPLSTGTWYRVEWFFNDAGAGSMEVRLDGSTIMTSSSFVGGTVAKFIVGLSYDQLDTTGTWYFDDIAINDTTGGSQTSWPGIGSIVHMQPDGAGDNSGCNAGNFASIDEVTPDDASTICTLITDGGGNIIDTTVESSSNAGIDSYDTVTLVQVGAREAAASAAAESWNLRAKSASGGTTSSGSTVTHNDATYLTNGDVAPRNYSLTSYTDPTTGIAWTPTGTNSLDNMQIGANSIDANPDINLSTLWALVETTPGSGPSITSRFNFKNARFVLQGGKRFLLRSQ